LQAWDVYGVLNYLKALKNKLMIQVDAGVLQHDWTTEDANFMMHRCAIH
jgi:hypothetical protein